MCVKHIFIYLYPNPANLETTISIFTLLFQIYIYIYIFLVDKSSKFYCKMKRNYSVHNDEHKAPSRSTSKSKRRSKRKLKIKIEVQLVKCLRSFKQSEKQQGLQFLNRSHTLLKFSTRTTSCMLAPSSIHLKITLT